MTKNRTPTPVYLDPGMHPGLEVKGLITKQYEALKGWGVCILIYSHYNNITTILYLSYYCIFPAVGTTPLQKRLKKTAIPRIFNWTLPPTPSARARGHRLAKRRRLEKEFQQEREKAWEDVGAEVTVSTLCEVGKFKLICQMICRPNRIIVL